MSGPVPAKRILVLGGHGFAGRHLLDAFAGSAHAVVPRSRRDGLDLRDFDTTRRALAEHAPDVVVHCAAVVGSLNYVTERAAEVVDENLRMLTNLYRAAAEVAPRAVIVNPVANCAYPGDLEVYREEDMWRGAIHPSVLSYGSTRRMMLVVAECYALQHRLRSVSTFVPNMYGPYDSTDPNKAHALNALVGKFVTASAEGHDVEVWGSGRPIREWLYAGDFGRVVRELVERMDGEAFDRPFNIGQNRGISIRQVVELLVAELGFGGRIVWDQSRPDGAPKKVMDDRRFREHFPHFTFTASHEGVRRTAAYYRSLLPTGLPTGSPTDLPT